MSARVCAAVLALVAGCGTPGPVKPPAGGSAAPVAVAVDAAPADAAPLDRDYPRLAARAVQMYQALLDALRAAGTDCAAATGKLGELRAAYAEVLAANALVIREGRERELKPALDRLAEQFEPAARAIVDSPALASCAEDPAFTAAFDALVGGS